MPIFEYKGLNKTGKTVKGTVDAENARTARSKLKKDGVFVVDLVDKTKAKKKALNRNVSSKKGVNVADMSTMIRQLATLLKANVPLVDSIGAVGDQVENATLKEAMYDCKNMVNEGSTFAKALMKYPRVFNKVFVSMAEAGEMSGTLDIILIRLAEFTEAQNELQAKVKSALIYPVAMTVFMGGMLTFMFIYVVPQMTSVFEDAGLELPWYTKIVISFSNILVNYGIFIAIAMVGLYFMFARWKATTEGRAILDAFILKIPVVGKMARMIAVSRFTRTLSTLLTGGVPMLNAMDIVRNVVDNAVLAEAVDAARINISEGESIAGPLKKSGQFPPLVIHMVNIGEKTGELENMLTQVSDSYDFQVKTQISGLTALLEPFMIIMMGGVIGVIVFALMIPMFEMANVGG